MRGLDSATSGTVYIGDVDLTSLKDNDLTRLRRDAVGFVFQAFNLVPDAVGAWRTSRCRWTSPAEGRTASGSTRSSTPSACATASRNRPSQLSGGQQQRVAAARALASRPQIVFADEPTGNLDSRAGAEVLTFLRRSVDDFGQTIVMVTHDPTAASYADHVLFLADGQIVDTMDDPTAERVLDRMKGFDGKGRRS